LAKQALPRPQNHCFSNYALSRAKMQPVLLNNTDFFAPFYNAENAHILRFVFLFLNSAKVQKTRCMLT
jgi:hypothetical protein